MLFKKFMTISSLKKIFLFVVLLYLFFKITDGSEQAFSIINKINFFYFIITIIFVFTLILLTIYLNMIIFNKFIKKKIATNYFFYSFIKSQILSYIFSLIGIVYRYHALKSKIKLENFIFINFFIIWFFLFFYLILYSFELLIFGFFLFPINIAIFIFLILTSFFIFIFPKIFKILKFNFLINLKNIIKNFSFFKNIKNKIYNFYSYISIELFFLGFLNHLISFLQIFFIFKMLGIPIQFNNLILIFVINSFLDQLPVITPKNIGVSEIIFGYLAEIGGLNFDYGVLFKFFLRFFNLFALIILFFLLKFKNKLLNIYKPI
jgi:hypothetical protein